MKGCDIWPPGWSWKIWLSAMTRVTWISCLEEIIWLFWFNLTIFGSKAIDVRSIVSRRSDKFGPRLNYTLHFQIFCKKFKRSYFVFGCIWIPIVVVHNLGWKFMFSDWFIFVGIFEMIFQFIVVMRMIKTRIWMWFFCIFNLFQVGCIKVANSFN